MPPPPAGESVALGGSAPWPCQPPALPVRTGGGERERTTPSGDEQRPRCHAPHPSSTAIAHPKDRRDAAAAHRRDRECQRQGRTSEPAIVTALPAPESQRQCGRPPP